MTRKWFNFYSGIALLLYGIAFLIEWKFAAIGIFAAILTIAINNRTVEDK